MGVTSALSIQLQCFGEWRAIHQKMVGGGEYSRNAQIGADMRDDSEVW